MKTTDWALVEALRARIDLQGEGRAALAKAYPDVPGAMLDTAVFHLFTDGCGAAVEWLACLEKFLRNPEDGLDYGATWHLLYHLYNWHQFQSLLPCGKVRLAEHLADAEQLLAEGDTESAARVLATLRAAVAGQLRPPNPGPPGPEAIG